jgi:fructuronate reductase
VNEIPRLSRALPGMPPAAPIRSVHLGIGNFARAHQGWYTSRAPDADQWGIAGFTGRGPAVADALGPQDGLYTLITRDADRDTFEVMSALSAVHPAADHEAYLNYLASAEIALVTITVTEAAYLRGADGRLDTGRDDVQTDLAALRHDVRARVTTLPGRLVAGLLARRSADAGPLTILSCDNLPGNGEVTQTVVHDLAEHLDPALAAWIDDTADFATSMVDRITPGTTEADRAAVRKAQGYVDADPVPTEPFHEWVISGAFPAGRPAWDAAGAAIVDDVEPFEQRKLWLLNGSHSQLAYAGSILGHSTIDQAIADPDCRRWVTLFWDEASRHLDFPDDEIRAYRDALLTRFANPRAQDQLARIAADGSQKLQVRTLPVARAERAAGRLPTGCATTLAAWVLHLRGLGAPVKDAGATSAQEAATGGDLDAAVPAVLGVLDADLAVDRDFVAAVVEQAHALESRS